MGVIKKFAIAVLLVSCITFIALFGRLPAFRYVNPFKFQQLSIDSRKEGANRSDSSSDMDQGSGMFPNIGRLYHWWTTWPFSLSLWSLSNERKPPSGLGRNVVNKRRGLSI